MVKIKECPCCEEKRFKPVEKITSQPIKFTVYTCVGCGLCFQNPMPDPKYLEKLYDDIYKKKYNLICAEEAFTRYNPKQEEKRLRAIEEYKKGGSSLMLALQPDFF